MFSNKYLIFLLCLYVFPTEAEDKIQFFASITIKIYRNETPVTVLRADTINNEYEATEIIIEDENIPTLKSGTFYNLTKLRYVSLKRNNINEIESYPFQYLPSARIINLNFNFIKRVPQNVFVNLPIRKLYLKGNGIQTLDALAFKNLTFLEILDLSSNNIEMIPENLFYLTKNLKHVNLNYNRLREGPKRGKVYLTGYFEEAFLNNIIDEHSVLDLSNNNFTYVDNFLLQGILCVKNILLSNNNIKKISDYAFRDILYVEILDLAGNNLEEISEKIMKKFEHIDVINLENNPWKMDFVCKYNKWCINHNKINTMDMNCTNTSHPV